MKNIFTDWKTDFTLETTLPLRKETIIYFCNFCPKNGQNHIERFFKKNLLKSLFLANQNILAMYVAK